MLPRANGVLLSLLSVFVVAAVTYLMPEQSMNFATGIYFFLARDSM